MSESTKDKIGRGPNIEKIRYLIDNLPLDDYFCLSLDGEWGSGKTFVMEKLKEELKGQNEHYLVVTYDAWKNNFYADPLIAILYCILDSIPKESLSGKNKRLVKNEIKKLIKEKAEHKFDMVAKTLSDKGGWASVCAFAMEFIKLIIKQAKSTILDNKLFDHYKSYQSLLNESIATLNALTAKRAGDSNFRRLVVIVDEIDRCLPNEQLIVLERIHHLFAVKNCAVIVALNKNAICKTFNSQYGGDGKEYLRKFFNYNFTLKTEYNILLQHLVMDFMDEINSNKNPGYVYTQDTVRYLYTALISEFSNISDGITYNNRDIINYFDKFIKVWDTKKTYDIIEIGFILFMLLYKQYKPSYFQRYKDGKYINGDVIQKFNFGMMIMGAYSFTGSQGLEGSYPFYQNSFCDNFTYFMNSVYLRYSTNMYYVLKHQIFHRNIAMYSKLPKDNDAIEEYFTIIDKYGTMTNES